MKTRQAVLSGFCLGISLLAAAVFTDMPSTVDARPPRTTEVQRQSRQPAFAFPYWQISDFNAANLNGHGAGNNAMWCGQTAAQMPDLTTPPGYGNNWDTSLAWRGCADSTVTHVRLHFFMNYDTEPSYDFFTVERLQNDATWIVLASYDGMGSNVEVDLMFSVPASDYTAVSCGGNEIVLRMRFRSDSAWSDEDGFWNTNGAVQIDDISTYFNSTPVSFADFEGGNDGGWTPVTDPGASYNPPNLAPICALPDSLCNGLEAGDPVTFNGLGSYDPDGQIASYEWDFGDGSTASGPTVMHTFANPGWYTTTLTVTDNRCCTKSCGVIVRICEPDTMGVGRVALDAPNGSIRSDVSYLPPAEMWGRLTYIKRYRFRHIREWPGRGEVYAVSSTRPLFGRLDDIQAYVLPAGKKYERDVRRSKKEKKCNAQNDHSCSTSSVNSDCRWVTGGESYTIFTDYAPGAAFCDLTTEIEWYELDKDVGKVLSAVGANGVTVAKCFGSMFLIPNTQRTVRVVKAIECGFVALDAIGKAITTINNIPYDRPKSIGKFQTGFGHPKLTSPPPGTASWAEQCEWVGSGEDGTITETKGREKKKTASVEFVTHIQTTGEYQSAGSPPGCGTCPTGGASSFCDLASFEYFQTSWGELQFRICTLNNLRETGIFGTREIVVAIDTDNNPATGDPDPPLCGADCYVSMSLQYTGSEATLTREIYCWMGDPCCPGTEAGWVLTEEMPCVVELDDCCMTFSVKYSSIGDPTGVMSAWALCRDQFKNTYETIPDDPCNTRLQITKTADTQCPRIEGLLTAEIEEGNLTAPVILQFSEPMSLPTVGQITISPFLNLMVTQDGSQRLIRVHPVGAWTPGRYELTLTGLQDLAGNGVVSDIETNSCGDPIDVELCIGDPNFMTTMSTGTPATQFSPDAVIYIQALGAGLPAGTHPAYVVPEDVLAYPGQALIDQTVDGPTPVTVVGGSINTVAVGNAVRPGDYVIVLDLNGNGTYEATDRASSPCYGSFSVGPPCDEPIAGLTAYWPFDDLVGNPASIELVAGRSALLVGSPTAVAGRVGRAVHTTPGNYLTVQDAEELALGVDDFSFSVWCRPTSTAGSTPLFDKRSGLTGYTLQIENGKAVLTMSDGLGVSTFTGAGTVNSGAWNHIVVSVTRDSPTGVTIFTNMQFSGFGDPTARSGSLDNTADLWIGRDRVSTSSYFTGDLDELAFWDEPLTVEEVDALYQAGLKGSWCPDGQRARDGDLVRPKDPEGGYTGGATAPAMNLQRTYELAIRGTFPNPFNPSTTIEFSLPARGSVAIEIYDVTGRKIRTLFEGNLPAGIQNVTWDARSDGGEAVSSGVYLVLMTTDFGRRSQKVLLLK